LSAALTFFFFFFFFGTGAVTVSTGDAWAVSRFTRADVALGALAAVAPFGILSGQGEFFDFPHTRTRVGCVLLALALFESVR
jgi:hypothetical protein